MEQKTRKRSSRTRSRKIAVFRDAEKWEDPIAEEFLQELSVASRSPRTLKAYRRAIGEMHLFRPGVSWEDLRAKDFREFLFFLMKKSRSVSFIRVTYSAYRSLYAWLVKGGKVKKSPLAEVELPRLRRGIPNPLTVEKMDQLIESAGSRKTRQAPRFGAARDKAILEVLYSTGMRVSELVSLNVEDVQNEEVRVRGKGGQVRIVFILDHARAALDGYLLETGHKEGPLFVSKTRKRLAPQNIWEIIHRAALAGGIGKVHPHMVRHSFATHLLNEGAGIRHVQELLGHKRLSTTQIYTKVAIAKTAEAYAAAHPRA